MSRSVSHTAIVEAVEPGWVSVAMQVDSACGSCKARHICGSGEEGERRIAVRVDGGEAWQVGDRAIVAIERSMGLKAVALAYLLPLMLVLAVLLVMLGQGVGEATAGLSALGVAALYYIGVWIFRDRLSQEIVFTLRKPQ